MILCKKPNGFASGYKRKNKWIWRKAHWKKCHCGLWHSNRFIPYEFWNQSWKVNNNKKRQKAGIILIRNFREVWITQSYGKCYGFPKGEKEQYETLQEWAKREFYEETGQNIDNLNLRGFVQIRTYIENVEYVYFIIHVPPEFNINTKPLDDVEITSYGWVRFDRINDLYLSKAVKKILNYKIIC